MRTRLFPAAILLAAFALNAELSMSHAADEAKRLPSLDEVQGAIPLLASTDKTKRLEATKTLFKLDRQALEALTKAGATTATTEGPRGLSNRRLDMVFTLIVGLPAKSDRYRSTSFGLFMEKDTTREQMLEMGKKYGFRVDNFDLDHYPSCWVQLTGQGNLQQVMREVLMNEPDVITVRLNYVEQGQKSAR